LKYVGVGRRFVALLIDWIIGLIWIIPLSQKVQTSSGTSYHLYNGHLFLAFAIAIVYAILFEGAFGATPGKFVLAIRVRMEDGSRITWGAAVIRNVLRIVDALPFFYIVGAVIMWTNPRRQRLGDKIAKTVVVRASSIGEPVAMPAGETGSIPWTPPPPTPMPGTPPPPAPPPPP
jgi:uncharacterized RDD family membrane protein YckC